MKPPADAPTFVLVSAAGRHAVSALWRDSGGQVCARESMLRRGMIFEQGQSVHPGANGQPDRITIRGVTVKTRSFVPRAVWLRGRRRPDPE